MEQGNLIEQPDIDLVTPELVRLALPWPPSVNHYQGLRIVFPKLADMIAQAKANGWTGFHAWLRSKSFIQTYPTAETKAFYTQVWSIVNRAGARMKWECKVEITMLCHPPDRRKRDNSNLWKCVEDGLEKASVVMNDNQFKKHHDDWLEPVKGGMVVVEMRPLVN